MISHSQFNFVLGTASLVSGDECGVAANSPCVLEGCRYFLRQPQKMMQMHVDIKIVSLEDLPRKTQRPG